MRGIQNPVFVEVFNCLTALESNVGGNNCTYSIESALWKSCPPCPSDVPAPLHAKSDMHYGNASILIWLDCIYFLDRKHSRPLDAVLMPSPVYECRECQEVFASAGELLVHLQHFHDYQRPRQVEQRYFQFMLSCRKKNFREELGLGGTKLRSYFLSTWMIICNSVFNHFAIWWFKNF